MALEWARLLQQQQDDGRLGLTPSFLVGALRRLPGALLGDTPGLPELRALIAMMRAERAPSGKVVSIFECQNIIQPVAALSSSDAQGDPIRSPAGGPPRLFVWPWVPSERPVDFDRPRHTLAGHGREIGHQYRLEPHVRLGAAGFDPASHLGGQAEQVSDGGARLRPGSK